MALNPATELGRLIGQGLAQANSYKDDFIETEEITDIDLYGIESINIVGSYFVTARYIIGSSTWGLAIWGSSLWASDNLISSTVLYSGLL